MTAEEFLIEYVRLTQACEAADAAVQQAWRRRHEFWKEHAPQFIGDNDEELP